MPLKPKCKNIMEDISSAEQDFHLWQLIVQTRDSIRRARRKELARYNIGPRQSAVLFAVGAIGEKATPAEISRWLLREPHSVSEIVSRMEKDGFVKKVKDLGRKNMVRVMLTKKGREAHHQSLKRESIHKIMSCLSAEQRQQLRSCLFALRNQALKELGMEVETPFPPL